MVTSSEDGSRAQRMIGKEIDTAKGHETQMQARIAKSRSDEVVPGKRRVSVGTLSTELVGTSGSSEQTHDTQKEDDASVGSFSTLLSESSSEDEESIDSRECNLEELQREFMRRDKLLERLSEGMARSYVRVMKQNEEAVRKLKLQRLGQEGGSNHQKVSSITQPHPSATIEVDADGAATINETQVASSLERMRHAFIFDAQNSLPGWAIIILYCVLHSSCNYLVETVSIALTKHYANQNVVEVCCVIIALVMLRMSGGLWDWLSDEKYERVKFDAHNRLRLGSLDARIHRWFRRRPNLQTLMNIVAFYLIYGSVCQLHDRCLHAFEKRHVIFRDLPSVKQGILTHVSERIAEGLPEEIVEQHLAESTCVDLAALNLGELHENLTQADDDYLASQLSAFAYAEFMGMIDAPFVGEWEINTFYFASVVVAVVLLKKLGHSTSGIF